MDLEVDMVMFLKREILHLGERISINPDDVSLYLQRAKLHFKLGSFDKAQNDFMRAAELDPSCEEASEYIGMIREIFEFRHTDIYNP